MNTLQTKMLSMTPVTPPRPNPEPDPPDEPGDQPDDLPPGDDPDRHEHKPGRT